MLPPNTLHEIEGVTYFLDPQQRARIYEKYDRGMRYELLHQASQQSLQRPYAPTSELAEKGVCVRPVLTAERAAALSVLCQMQGPECTDPQYDVGIFEEILTPEVDTQIVSFFQSEYAIMWYKFDRKDTSAEQNISFRWHCDGGPQPHLKILVYLNDHREHGGTTLFLDRETTRQFAEVGYLFGEVSYRQSDLAPLARKYAIPYHEMDFRPKAGEGLIFAPSQTLHKGMAPLPGKIRNLFILCLIPFPHPWRNALQELSHTSIKEHGWIQF